MNERDKALKRFLGNIANDYQGVADYLQDQWPDHPALQERLESLAGHHWGLADLFDDEQEQPRGTDPSDPDDAHGSDIVQRGPVSRAAAARARKGAMAAMRDLLDDGAGDGSIPIGL